MLLPTSQTFYLLCAACNRRFAYVRLTKAGRCAIHVNRPQEVASAADVETAFPREVAETFLRCKRDGFDQTNAIIELNALKIAEDRTFADCARYVFTTILGGALARRRLRPRPRH